MVRTKVFVGNLSFSTKENELAKEFAVAGTVTSANIITRGPRSLGYGFVEMENETDAANAVKLLDKKEIDGRPINVEVAKPREEGADAARSANAQGTATGTGANGERPRRRAPRGPRAPRSDSQGGPSNNSQPRQSQGQGQNTNAQTQQGGNQQQFRRRKSDEEGDKRRAPRDRPARPARAEGEADTRTPSTTTLFVANLPFSIEDDSFAKVIKDASLAYKTAHVVKKRTGRSKGFGFIEFDNEADQQKALAALNNKEVDGRPLAVKVALTELRSEDLVGANSSPAATKAASSPAKSTTAPVKSSTTPAQTTPTQVEKPSTPKQEKK